MIDRGDKMPATTPITKETIGSGRKYRQILSDKGISNRKLCKKSMPGYNNTIVQFKNEQRTYEPFFL